MLLGYYENFPETIHGIVRFTHNLPYQKVQQVMLSTFHQLNKEIYELNAITRFVSTHNCQTSFEFGVAEGAVFNYLDKEELDRFHRRLAKNPMSTIDVFCVVRYHIVNKKKRTPLRFDYHVLRFTFDKNNVGLQILHERGTQRIPLEGLVKFITKRINEGLLKSGQESLCLKYVRTLF